MIIKLFYTIFFLFSMKTFSAKIPPEYSKALELMLETENIPEIDLQSKEYIIAGSIFKGFFKYNQLLLPKGINWNQSRDGRTFEIEEQGKINLKKYTLRSKTPKKHPSLKMWVAYRKDYADTIIWMERGLEKSEQLAVFFENPFNKKLTSVKVKKAIVATVEKEIELSDLLFLNYPPNEQELEEFKLFLRNQHSSYQDL